MSPFWVVAAWSFYGDLLPYPSAAPRASHDCLTVLAMADDGMPVQLSPQHLNRALLARQPLLERSGSDLPEVIEQMGFLQAQYAPSMYVGLWSRVRGFRREHLTSALEERRVVQGTLLRSTIHLVSAHDWWPAALAVRSHRRRWWVAAHRRLPGGAPDVEAAARRVRNLLADGPRRRADLVTQLGLDSPTWNGVNLWLDLVRVPPSGTWERRRADLYALAEDWVGPPPPGATEAAGVELLLRRYLAGFGPASLADAANWAGVPPAVMADAARGIELERFVDESGKELLDLPGAPLPDPATPAPVRFLPTWDATLLVHARRSGILAEDHRPLLFSTRTPQSRPSFLVDGQVAGTWRFGGGRILTEPFEPLPASVRRQVDDEAERLIQLHL